MQKEKVMERGTGDGKWSCVFKYDHTTKLTILGIKVLLLSFYTYVIDVIHGTIMPVLAIMYVWLLMRHTELDQLFP